MMRSIYFSDNSGAKQAPPRPAAATSIPALLHLFQNEWDTLVLETFALKQKFNSVQQQLSHALYKEDAATRVIARLIKERDAARECVVFISQNMFPTHHTAILGPSRTCKT